MRSAGFVAYWYINGIPVARADTEALEPDFDSESISETVHYKGSSGGSYHANGFAPETLPGIDVRVHESNHQTLRALRQQSVTYAKVKGDDQRTVVLDQYNARREGGTCYYRGTMSFVEV